MSESNLITRDSDNRTTERSAPMTRIRIDDLPVAEELTPEQEALIQGAGLKSFRPSIEALEGREVPALIAPGVDLTRGVLTVDGSNSHQNYEATVRLQGANTVIVSRGTSGGEINQATITAVNRAEISSIVFQGMSANENFTNYSGIPSTFNNQQESDRHVAFNMTGPSILPPNSASGSTAVGGQRLGGVIVGGQPLGGVVVRDGQPLDEVVVGGQRLADVRVDGRRIVDQRLENGQRLGEVVGDGQSLSNMRVNGRRPGEFQSLGQVVVGGQRIGQNIHPTLQWQSVPPDAGSLVLVFKDKTPDRTRTPPGHVGDYHHEVIYNIPPTTREIRTTADGNLEGIDRQGNRTFVIERAVVQGESPASATGPQLGVDDFGNPGYNGPNPRNGEPHTYEWTLYALSTPTLQLQAGERGTAADVQRAIQNNMIGQASFQSTYAYPPGLQSQWND
jgi:Raf kinase inhibitor-like YbhB/YbcL family protein